MAVVIPQIKNSSSIVRELETNLVQRTNLTLTGKDSKAGALQSIFANQLVVSRREVIQAFTDSTLNAKGPALDRVGNELGIQRLSVTKARAESTAQVFAFYVSSGTFGTLNSGLDIIIPGGTEVFSEQDQNDLGRRIRYITVGPTTLLAGDTINFVTIEAEGTGSTYNVGENVLVNHNFVNYSSGTGLLCINFYSILNGRDRQEDFAYKASIANYFASLPIVNDLRVKFSALQIPGILDSKIIDAFYGIGTSAIVILGPEFKTTTTVLNQIQVFLNSMALPGMRLYAIPATTATVDIEITVQNTNEFTNSEKLRISNRILAVSRRYLRNLGINGVVDLNNFYNFIVENVTNISFLKDDTLLFNNVNVSRNNSTATHPGFETLASRFYQLDEIEYADIGDININYI